MPDLWIDREDWVVGWVLVTIAGIGIGSLVIWVLIMMVGGLVVLVGG